MANVSFLRGTQSKLDTLLAAGSGYTEGAFYLTTDSDRLYFAQSATELVHLNHNVIHVANVAALPAVASATEGDFYYAKEENVLCTKVNGAWKQINKDTNTNNDTSVTGVDDVKVTSTTDGGITVSFDIKQTSKNLITNTTSAVEDIPVSFTIKGSDIATANNVAVGVATTAVTNGAKIATNGDGSSGAGFNLTATGNATITRDTSGNLNITAKDTTYGLGASNDKIVLTNVSDNTTQNIGLSSGNGSIVVSGADNAITVTHTDYKTETSSAAASKPAHGGSFTVLDSLTVERGHVTGIITKNVTLPADNNTTSVLSTENNTITLQESDGKNYSATFENGNDDIGIATSGATGAATIKVSHKTYGAPTASKSAATDTTPGHGGKFTVVDGVVTSNGHVTGYTTKEITLPADNNTTNSSATANADNTGKITVTVEDSSGKTVTGTSGQVLYYTVNGQKVYNQGNIDFYTKDEIDGKIEAVNAMTYKGTVGANGTVTALPTSDVKIGDTYKVASAGTYGDHQCDVGDLLIAIGTEEDGVITSTTLEWTYIPSGDDTDSQYSLSAANNTITLTNTTSNKSAGTAVIAAGASNDDIEVSTASGTITVAHKDYDTPDVNSNTELKPAHGGSFTILEGVTTENGHITGVTNRVVTLPADNNTTYTFTVADNTATLTGSDNKTGSVTIAGDGTYTSAETTGTTIKVKHKTYSNLTATEGEGLEPGHGGSFTVVTGVTRDSGGHLNGFTTQEVTLPADNNTTSSLGVEAKSNTIKLTESNGTSSSVTVSAGNQIAVSSDTANTIKIAHGEVTTSATTSTDAPGHGATFTVIDTINTSNGHVTSVNTKTVTLPPDNNTTYNLSGNVATANNVATFTTTLTGSDGKTPTSVAKFSSSSLKVTNSDNIIKMDLEWGSF